MKTTVDIPDDVLREAMHFAGAKTKREVVVRALEEFNRRQRVARLAAYLGRFENLITLEDLARSRQADEVTRRGPH